MEKLGNLEKKFGFAQNAGEKLAKSIENTKESHPSERSEVKGSVNSAFLPENYVKSALKFAKLPAMELRPAANDNFAQTIGIKTPNNHTKTESYARKIADTSAFSLRTPPLRSTNTFSRQKSVFVNADFEIFNENATTAKAA